MNSDLVNLYIEQLLTEIGENAKARILLQTQIKYTELLNAQLQNRVNDLENSLQLKTAEMQAQVEKLNKKKSKEVNTSNDDTF